MKQVRFLLSFTRLPISKRMGSYTPMAAYALSIRSKNATRNANSKQRLRLLLRNCKATWRQRKPSLRDWHWNFKKLKRRLRSWHWNLKKLRKKTLIFWCWTCKHWLGKKIPKLCKALFKARQAASKKKILLVSLLALTKKKPAWAAALICQKETQNTADPASQSAPLAIIWE